jgi:hypothetical protein
VKYEKLGQMCFACGLIGHEYKECGDGIYDEKNLKFGEWIYANGWGRGTYTRGNSRGGFGGVRGRDGSFAGGRGGVVERGRGRGFVDWRDHPERKGVGNIQVDPELLDTASSPVKQGDEVMTEAEKIAKRRLDFDNGPGKGVLAIVPSDMLVEGVEGNKDQDQESSSDSKRQKKSDGASISNQNEGSAASLEDDRRAQ